MATNLRKKSNAIFCHKPGVSQNTHSFSPSSLEIVWRMDKNTPCDTPHEIIVFTRACVFF
jgi:hypothetical protein